MTEAEVAYQLQQLNAVMKYLLPSTNVLIGLGAVYVVRSFWGWGGLPIPITPRDKLLRGLSLVWILSARTMSGGLCWVLFAIGWWAWPSGVTEVRLADLTLGVLLKATGAIVAYLVSCLFLLSSIIASFRDYE